MDRSISEYARHASGLVAYIRSLRDIVDRGGHDISLDLCSWIRRHIESAANGWGGCLESTYWGGWHRCLSWSPIGRSSSLVGIDVDDRRVSLLPLCAGFQALPSHVGHPASSKLRRESPGRAGARYKLHGTIQVTMDALFHKRSLGTELYD